MRHAHFAHLRCHTEYSLLSSSNRVGALVERAAEYRLPALAITDAGNLFAAVQFFQKCMDAGIKPILGAEAFIAPGSRMTAPRGRVDETTEVVLLCKDESGWENLMTLLSRAHLESHFVRPQVDRELLAEHAGGLICLTGGPLQGALPRRMADSDVDGAKEMLGWLRQTYGDDNVYVEICQNNVPAMRQVNLNLIHLAHDTGTPLVATADTRYLNPEDARAHDALLCIGTGANLDEEERERLPEGDFHFKHPDQMVKDFSGLEDAIANTITIAQRCNVDLRFDTYHMPQFEVPAEHTPESYLKAITLAGLHERFAEDRIPEDQQQTYIDRVEWELSTINKMGYPGYFLIVWDIIHYAREQGIPVGPGRGSAAGSLVSYALRITDLDPLPYNLLFERFLNPDRVSLPDIDMDFCMDNRDRVIQYVADKYGADHVCQIITFGTMGAKAVLRDVARVLDFSFMESDRIAKLVPNTLGMTLKQALKEEPKLLDLVKSDERVAELMAIARNLEGLARHASTHAAGVVISENKLTRHTPLYKGPHDEVLSQFYKDDAEAVGLVKFDFLGLKTLTVIEHAIQEVRRTGVEVNFTGIPLDEKETYALLCRGDTTGVFQLESTGMKDLIVKMQPDSFEDLVALLALYRPGPIGSGMLDDFISRKKGTTPIVYDLPELEPVLKETYGVIVYQEQVMRIANVVAGYSLGEADLLRRAMGKKKASEMEKQKIRFIEGARGKGFKSEVAEKIFDLMAYFAGYGFNKSHSAAYAVVSFQTAYLKAHHPVQFMAALLTNDMAHPDKTAKNITEVREMGIPLLPPDINKSQIRFTSEELPPELSGESGYTLGIRYGLGGIKGVGEAALESVIATRDADGVFSGLFDLTRRIDLNKANKRVLEALTCSGALDHWSNRATLFEATPAAMEDGARVREEQLSGQATLFGAAEAADPTGLIVPLPEWDEHEKLAREKETLGFYLSSHPMRRYRDDVARFATTDTSLGGKEEGKDVRVAGLLTDIRGRITKKGDRMAFLTIEDEAGVCEVIAFPDAYQAAEPILIPDTPLLVSGTVDGTDQGSKVKATRIESLIEVRKRAVRKVVFKFTSTGMSRGHLASLKDVIRSHPGPCEVHLQVHVPGQVNATLAAAPMLTVSADDALIRDAERVLGRGSVAFG
ncbi:MAG: DNA polymerase III subunit alpha [Leptospirillia bacterium]